MTGANPDIDSTAIRLSGSHSHDCDRCLSADGPGMTAFWVILISLFFVVLTKFIRSGGRKRIYTEKRKTDI